jgi:retron-type reverse transcriptase
MVAKLVYIYIENNEDPDVVVKSYLMSDGEIVYDTDVKSLVDSFDHALIIEKHSMKKSLFDALKI